MSPLPLSSASVLGCCLTRPSCSHSQQLFLRPPRSGPSTLDLRLGLGGEHRVESRAGARSSDLGRDSSSCGCSGSSRLGEGLRPRLVDAQTLQRVRYVLTSMPWYARHPHSGAWSLESGVWGLKIFSTLTSTTRLSAYPRSFASCDLLGFGPSGYFTGRLVAGAHDLSRAR